jgi:hypothetical protein
MAYSIDKAEQLSPPSIGSGSYNYSHNFTTMERRMSAILQIIVYQFFFPFVIWIYSYPKDLTILWSGSLFYNERRFVEFLVSSDAMARNPRVANDSWTVLRKSCRIHPNSTIDCRKMTFFRPIRSALAAILRIIRNSYNGELSTKRFSIVRWESQGG